LSPRAAGRSALSKLSFSQQTYQDLTASWRIPAAFFRAVCQQLSVISRCKPSKAPFRKRPTWPKEASDDSSEDDQHIKPIPHSISKEANCLIIRGDIDCTWDYGLALIHDPNTNITRAVCVGLSLVEIDLIVAYLDKSKPFAAHPLLLPILLLDLAVDDICAVIKLRIKLLNEIQRGTGMDRFSILHKPTRKGDSSESNLDWVMQRLTCLSDWMAAHTSFTKTQSRALTVIKEMASTDGFMGPKNASTSFSETERQLEERLEFIESTLEAAHQKLEYFDRSIAAQVQTVYTLIGQKDNRLNIASAEASRQIADDSRRVAILTRRDSTDMRIIAAVTLVFLPGTFVATLFSTSFFNFPNSSAGDTAGSSSDPQSDSGQIVSSYIWIYFAITAALTLLVLAGWYGTSYFQGKKMLGEFGIEARIPTTPERSNTDKTLADKLDLWREGWDWRGIRRKRAPVRRASVSVQCDIVEKEIVQESTWNPV
jgi:hypothetical protein